MPEDSHVADSSDPVDTDTSKIADGDEVLGGTEAISQDPDDLPEGTVTAEGTV